MDILTKANKSIEILNKYQYIFNGTEYCNLLDSLEYLKKYEDTGIEAEDVQDLKDCVEGEEGTEGTVEDLLELMRYRRLEEQGLLIKMPCKPHTKVYEIYTKYDDKEDKYIKGIEELLLIRFGKNRYNDYAVLKGEDGEDFVTLGQFGKTIFLTRKEAEKELERLKGEVENENNMQ